MPAYTTVKKLSRAISYSSATMVVVFLALIFLNRNSISADQVGSTDTSVISSAKSSHLQISATSNITPQTGSKITIKVTTPTLVANGSNVIRKVVLYACSDPASTVMSDSSDSSSCTYKDVSGATKDAIKTAWAAIIPGETTISGLSTFIYDSFNQATLTYTWNTSGTAIGDHSVMVKAFTGNEEKDFLEKIATDVKISASGSTASAITDDSATTDTASITATDSTTTKEPVTLPSKITSIDDLIQKISLYIETIIAILTVIGFIVGGIYYLTAGSNPQNAEKGKKTIFYSLIGLAIFILLFAIEKTIISIANGIPTLINTGGK